MSANEAALLGMAKGEGNGEMSEAEIDANVEEASPASDPPSWTLGSDHRSQSKKQNDEDQPRLRKDSRRE